MRILLISSFLPYPLDSGGHVRLYNILKELSKNNSITLICEKRTYQTAQDIEEVKKLCEEVITIDRKKQWSLKNIQKTAISKEPFLVVGHTLSEMKQIIIEKLKGKTFHLIHVETFYVAQNLPKTYLPIVLVEHNIEYMVYKKYAHTAPIFLRPLLLADITKIKLAEEKWWKAATKVVAVSEEDKKMMKGIDAAVVPNGVDIKKFVFAKQKIRKEKRVLFIGNFKWIQNQHAAEKILSEIWPKIKENLPGDEKVMLWIVGKHIPENIKTYSSSDILIDENAPDATEKIYQKSDILLAPIEVGGGSSYKIIEAMASGLPVVTTQLGIGGLGAKADTHALVGGDSNELAAHVVGLLKNPALNEKLRKNARDFIEKEFSWPTITQKLEEVYKLAREEAA
ncbi:MAG TPA: glycosyltransferase family 4 protein [Patescibacteria group bacterium]